MQTRKKRKKALRNRVRVNKMRVYSSKQCQNSVETIWQGKTDTIYYQYQSKALQWDDLIHSEHSAIKHCLVGLKREQYWTGMCIKTSLPTGY